LGRSQLHEQDRRTGSVNPTIHSGRQIKSDPLAPRRLKPIDPVGAIEDSKLATIVRRDVGPGLYRQHGDGFSDIFCWAARCPLCRTRLALFREQPLVLPLLLLVLGIGELIEAVGDDEAAAARELAEIIDRLSVLARPAPRDSDDDPNWPPYERSREAITAARAKTLDGLLAKARAAKAEARQPGGREEPAGTPAEDWAWDLVNDLLALGGRGGAV
jgi:hypothetical protein